MKPLTERIAEARDIAVERERDVRIEEFLRAMKVGNRQSAEGSRNDAASMGSWQSAVGSRADTPVTGRIELSVDCHFRSWHRSIRAEEAARLEVMTPGDLAQTIAGWVQDAIKQGLLLLSNPPRQAVGNRHSAVGGVLTCTYNPNRYLAGTRWG